jgi:hypothetical protein
MLVFRQSDPGDEESVWPEKMKKYLFFSFKSAKKKHSMSRRFQLEKTLHEQRTSNWLRHDFQIISLQKKDKDFADEK